MPRATNALLTKNAVVYIKMYFLYYYDDDEDDDETDDDGGQ